MRASRRSLRSLYNRGSFGPVVRYGDDGSATVECGWCIFRSGSECTHSKPRRTIPDPRNTPEWCVMRADMVRDAAEMHATEPGA